MEKGCCSLPDGRYIRRQRFHGPPRSSNLRRDVRTAYWTFVHSGEFAKLTAGGKSDWTRGNDETVWRQVNAADGAGEDTNSEPRAAIGALSATLDVSTRFGEELVNSAPILTRVTERRHSLGALRPEDGLTPMSARHAKDRYGRVSARYPPVRRDDDDEDHLPRLRWQHPGACCR